MIFLKKWCKFNGVWKRQKRGRVSRSDDWSGLIHPGTRVLTFISIVMLTVYSGKCHRLQNQQKNARLKHCEDGWSRTAPDKTTSVNRFWRLRSKELKINKSPHSTHVSVHAHAYACARTWSFSQHSFDVCLASRALEKTFLSAPRLSSDGCESEASSVMAVMELLWETPVKGIMVGRDERERIKVCKNSSTI